MHIPRAGTETIEIPGRLHVLLIAFVVLPPAIFLQSALVVMFAQMPWPLILSLLVTVVSGGLVAMAALETLTGAKVELSPEGVRIDRLLGSTHHPWQDIKAVKLIRPDGTQPDETGQASARRLGIGIFLRKQTGEQETSADVILCAASDQEASSLLSIVERIEGYQTLLGRTSAQRRRAGMPPARGGFRRPARTTT